MTLPPCWPWRWLHRRRRWIDRSTVYVEICRRVSEQHRPLSDIAGAWAMHRALPGQEHWGCPCAAEEGEP